MPKGAAVFWGAKPPESPAQVPVLAGPGWDRARLILAGDWGSGLPRAQRVATAMRAEMEQGQREGVDTHVIHLGDVYYSGWEYEYENRFLKHWPVRPAEADRIGSWSLNGNHDMYSGGYAYYGTLLGDARFARQAGSSFFQIENAHWRIFGLDTAWDENGLKDPQAAWIRHGMAGDPRKTIFLSHHQLCSAYEDTPAVGSVLREKLGNILTGEGIAAAFWGHEHRCVLYDAMAGVRYPRLIGHGGIPTYMTHDARASLPASVTFEDRRFIENGFERWAYFGFSVLDFEHSRINVRYVDETGETIRSEILE